MHNGNTFIWHSPFTPVASAITSLVWRFCKGAAAAQAASTETTNVVVKCMMILVIAYESCLRAAAGYTGRNGNDGSVRQGETKSMV